MPFDFNAPQANPNPAAYGPLDVGLAPHLLEMSRTIAANLRARRQEEMRQAQMQREAELHRMAMEQHGQDIQSRIAQRETLYTGWNETVPGGTQTVEEPAAPQMPSPETQVGAGLRTDPAALQRAFGALGLGSNLPGPATPWKTQQVERQMPDQVIHHPGFYEQRLENTAGYQNRMAGAAEQNANTRQAGLGIQQQRADAATARANQWIASARARAAADQQRFPGQITPSVRAAKRAQILQQAMTNPVGMGGLRGSDLDSLSEAADETRGWTKAKLANAMQNPAMPSELRASLEQMYPFMEQ